MAKKKAVKSRKVNQRKDIKPTRELCCCPPRAMVWIDSKTSCCFIENKIDMSRRLQTRADAAATIQLPGGPAQDAQAGSGSQLDEGTYKDQGKVYRSDVYTIHWQSDGQCLPLQVSLSVSGAIQYRAECLPMEGEVTLSQTYMLEPPDYAPPGDAFVSAELLVEDCTHASALCENTVARP